MASMAMPATSSPSEASAASTELQIDLAPDDLKKVQIRTARVANGVTSAKLRVPGIVKPNEYREVHVTPLVGGVVKGRSSWCLAITSNAVNRWPSSSAASLPKPKHNTFPISRSSKLNTKKLERTQNLLQTRRGQSAGRRGSRTTHAAHESHVRAALEKLKLLGASDRQIAALKQAEQINPNLVVPAPIGGVVLTRNANLGLVVNASAGTLHRCRPLDGVDYGERQRERLCRCPRRLAGQHHRSRLSRPQLEGPRHLHSTASGPCNTHRTSTH